MLRLKKVSVSVYRPLKALSFASVTVDFTAHLLFVKSRTVKVLSVRSRLTAHLSLVLPLSVVVRFVARNFTIYVSVVVNLHVSKRSSAKQHLPSISLRAKRGFLHWNPFFARPARYVVC